jgi:hypothetical protein
LRYSDAEIYFKRFDIIRSNEQRHVLNLRRIVVVVEFPGFSQFSGVPSKQATIRPDIVIVVQNPGLVPKVPEKYKCNVLAM